MNKILIQSTQYPDLKLMLCEACYEYNQDIYIEDPRLRTSFAVGKCEQCVTVEELSCN